MTVKKDFISKLLYLSHWQTEIHVDKKKFTAVFMGKYKKALLFETDKLNSSMDIHDMDLNFNIFIPSMTISGNGRCLKAAEVEGLRGELLVRFMIEPEILRVRQQRSFKRFPVVEKAMLISEEQESRVVVKDISLSGIGVISFERIRAVRGKIHLIKPGIDIVFHKIHEFTDYNIFQYGMRIDENIDNEKLKKHLLETKERINSFNIEL
jgi:hypothetical protein